jgi:signal transduction histidine kinase
LSLIDKIKQLNTDPKWGLLGSQRVVMLFAISFIGIFFLLLLGITALYQGNKLLGIIDLFSALFLFANILFYYLSRRYILAAFIGIVFMEILVFVLIFIGGQDKTAHMWSFIFPLVSFFLLGRKRGLATSLSYLAIVIVYFTIQHRYPMGTIYSTDFHIRFIASYSVVVIFAAIFEHVREFTQKELLVANDVSESANEAKSDFLASMSHELRTPLNHIIGFSELLLDNRIGELNETQGEYLEDVLGSSRHLLSLINDILDISKIEAGKMELEISDVPIEHVLENAVNMVIEKALAGNIKLIKEFRNLPPVIKADLRKLKQILYNLLSNALKFSKTGGWVKIEADLLKIDGREYLDIHVADNGIGITSEDLERIFDPFEQGKQKERFSQGTGLGLSLTKELINLHGGSLEAASKGRDTGSEFRFTLPIGGPL